MLSANLNKAAHQPADLATNQTFKLLPQHWGLDLTFLNLRYTVQPHKIILNDVSGEMRSGELTAIIGSSGAGKTTLLNILSGYKSSHVDGVIRINGETRNLKTFKKLSAYIMQDDYLQGNLTIHEAMTIAAELKLSKHVTQQAKKQIISEILETLRLAEGRNTLTHKLSGGERKRLSIGLELISNPPIMFFDEPTSGLDSLTCFQCIKLLKLLAVGGRNIICTVHQPSARLLEMFDQLYALADGKCIYQGKVSQLLPYLEARQLHCPSFSNPTDYLIEIVTDQNHNKIALLVDNIQNGKRNIQIGKAAAINKNNNNNNNQRDSNKESELSAYTVLDFPNESKELTEPFRAQSSDFPISDWQQFLILSKRTFLTTKRDLTLTYLRIGTQFIVSFLMCSILGGSGNDASKVISNFTLLQFILLYLTTGNMLVAVLVIPNETTILLKEHFNHWYSLKSYYLATTLIDIPFQILTCTIFISFVYYYSEQPMELYRFLLFLLICQLLSFVAQSFGYLVGSAFSIKTSIILTMAINIPLLLYAGFFVPFGHMPFYLSWFSYLSYMRYGFEGLTLSIYGYDREPIKCYKAYCPLRKSNFVLELFSLNAENYLFDVIILVVFFIIIRYIAFIFLKWKLIRKQ